MELTFGTGATYDSIEGRFRIIRREAAVLKEEIEKGDRPEAPLRGGGANKPAPSASTAASSFAESIGTKSSTPRKPRAPKKGGIKQEDSNRVLTGRVSKNTNTPQKSSKMVKEESFDADEGFDIELDTQKDLEHNTFMETLHQVDFEDALQYQGTMGI